MLLESPRRMRSIGPQGSKHVRHGELMEPAETHDPGNPYGNRAERITSPSRCGTGSKSVAPSSGLEDALVCVRLARRYRLRAPGG